MPRQRSGKERVTLQEHRWRVRVSTLMIGIAVVGILLGALRSLGQLLSYNDGPHQLILATGQPVVVFGREEAEVPVYSISAQGLAPLLVATRCVVVHDPAGDEDDC